MTRDSLPGLLLSTGPLEQRDLHPVGVLEPDIAITPWSHDGRVDQRRAVCE